MGYSNKEMTPEQFKESFRQKNKENHQQRIEAEAQFTEIELEESAIEADDNQGGDSPSIPTITLPESGEVIKLLKVPRFHGHSKLNSLVKKDWIKTIEQSRDSFDGILYRATEANPIIGEDVKNFTEINNHQKKLTYEDPVIVKLLDSPNMDEEHFTAMDNGDGHDSLDGDVLLLRAGADYIPHGSIFSFYEEVDSDRQRLVSWYVLDIYIYGAHSAGYLYVCVPAMGLIESNSGKEFN